jgi:hypothetical protein
MDVGAEFTQSDVKQSLYDENVQLAFISSLVLTMVFPLMYEFNGDWIEIAQTGFIARWSEYLLGFSVFDDEYFGIWHDISMAGYNWGVGCMMCAVVTCLVQLVVVNQLTEEQALTYVMALGPTAKKYCFRAMVAGLILPLAGPMSLRINATMQTFGGFFHYGVTAIILTGVGIAIFRTIKALYVCIEEAEAYDDIALTEQDIQARAELYFDNFANDYTIEGFSNALMFVTKKKYKVPLTYPTKVRACKCFYRELCKREGLKISDDTLADLSIYGANNFKINHQGQEMEFGDDITEMKFSGKKKRDKEEAGHKL